MSGRLRLLPAEEPLESHTGGKRTQERKKEAKRKKEKREQQDRVVFPVLLLLGKQGKKEKNRPQK